MKKSKHITLSRAEFILWCSSVLVIVASYIISGSGDILTLTASLIGVSALILVAKGLVIGQILTIVFSLFYGIISFIFGYYGEMITYLGMSTPIAVISMISWIRNPYKDTKIVRVSTPSKKQIIIMHILAVAVTTAFYFILSALGNKSLILSTASVFTSFVAAYLTFLRSPYYAIGYSANDIILIILWTIAATQNIKYVPMILCFVMFLFNDLYGFCNWQKMKKEQSL